MSDKVYNLEKASIGNYKIEDKEIMVKGVNNVNFNSSFTFINNKIEFIDKELKFSDNITLENNFIICNNIVFTDSEKFLKLATSNKWDINTIYYCVNNEFTADICDQLYNLKAKKLYVFVNNFSNKIVKIDNTVLYNILGRFAKKIFFKNIKFKNRNNLMGNVVFENCSCSNLYFKGSANLINSEFVFTTNNSIIKSDNSIVSVYGNSNAIYADNDSEINVYGTVKCSNRKDLRVIHQYETIVNKKINNNHVYYKCKLINCFITSLENIVDCENKDCVLQLN